MPGHLAKSPPRSLIEEDSDTTASEKSYTQARLEAIAASAIKQIQEQKEGLTAYIKDVKRSNEKMEPAKLAEEPVEKKARKLPRWWSATDAMTISSVVLIFGLLLIGFVAYVVRTRNMSNLEVRLIVIVTVIFSSIFLVVAGYDDSQIAPAMGLLGTIIGYTLKGNCEPS